MRWWLIGDEVVGLVQDGVVTTRKKKKKQSTVRSTFGKNRWRRYQKVGE